MDTRGWIKTVAMAVGGGALGAISATLLDPNKFNLRDGIGDEAAIAIQGAITGLVGLFMGSPKGKQLLNAGAASQKPSEKK